MTATVKVQMVSTAITTNDKAVDEEKQKSTSSANSVAVSTFSSVNTASTAVIQSDQKTKNANELYTVEKLVEMGKNREYSEGGSGNENKLFRHEEISKLIKEKMDSLFLASRNKSELPSVREALSKLSEISEAHYGDLKGQIFDLLIRLLNEDPIEQFTSRGISNLIVRLNNYLNDAKKFEIPLQTKLAKAHGAAVELYLLHYGKKHVNAWEESEKKGLISAQEKLEALNKNKDVELKFACRRAIEACKKLITDNKKLNEFFDRLGHIASALKKAYDKDLSGFFSEMGSAFQDLSIKIKREWFGELFILRDLVRQVPETKKLQLILSRIEKCQGMYQWRYEYGALLILEEVISKIDNPELLDTALFGKSIDKSAPTKTQFSTKMEASTVLGSSALQALNQFPGLIDFINFNGYKSPPKVNLKNVRKSNERIQKKSKLVCEGIIKQLDSTIQGRKLMFKRYTTGDVKKNSILHDIIPRDERKRHDWLATPTIIPKTERARLRDTFNLESPRISKKTFVVSTNVPSTKDKVVELNPIEQNTKLEKSESIDSERPSSPTVDYELMCSLETDFRQAMAKRQFDEILKLISSYKDLVDTKDSEGKTALLLAAKQELWEVCENLLKAGANPDVAIGIKSWNIIQFAALKGKINIIKVLDQKHKELLRLQDNDGISPLMLSAEEGHKEVCECLLQENVNPLATDKDGFTALHLAAKAGNNIIVKMVIDHIVKALPNDTKFIDVKTKDGFTPFMLAAQEGHLDTCKMLIAEGKANLKESDIQGFNALHLAIMAEKPQIVSWLSNLETSLLGSTTNDDSTALILVAKKGSRTLFDLLLKFDPQLLKLDLCDKKGFAAIHWAAMNDNADFIAKLADKAEWVVNLLTVDYMTPLMISACYGKTKACACLLSILKKPEEFKKKNLSGYNAFHLAAKNGQLEIIKLFLNNNELLKLINSKSKDNDLTPLMLAAHNDHTTISKTLLESKAHYNLKDMNGFNALHWAAFGGSEGVLELFLQIKEFVSLIDAPDALGCTPLMYAAESGSEKACRLLLNKNADILKSNNQKETALHIATLSENFSAVKLLSNSKDFKKLINQKDRAGFTAFDLALEKDNVDICQILIINGAIDSLAAAMDVMKLAINNNSIGVVKLIPKIFKDVVKNNGSTLLICACKQNHVEIFEALLQLDADPFSKDKDEGTALNYAIMAENTKFFRLLLTHRRKEINAYKTEKKETVLTLAIKQKKLEICKLLLNEGLDSLIPEPDEQGWHALIHAIDVGDMDILIYLLSFMQKYPHLVNKPLRNGRTPITFAKSLGVHQILKSKVGADPSIQDDKGRNAMHWGVINSDDIVRSLIDYPKVDLCKVPTNEGYTPLLLAATHGKYEAFKLLEGGSDIKALQKDGWNAIHCAAASGEIRIIEPFLKEMQAISAPSKEGFTPLMIAALNGRLKVCQELLLAGVDVTITVKQDTFYKIHEKLELINQNGWNALHFAAAAGKIEVIKLITDTDPKLISSKACDDYTPLLLTQSREACEALLKAGADPIKEHNLKGFNVMHFAAISGNNDILKLFIKTHKSLVDSRTKALETPFILAAKHNQIQIMDTLSTAGANPYAVDKNDWNAMHHAASNSCDVILQQLCNHKDFINSKTKNGYTPLMLASRNGMLNICATLIDAEADGYAKDNKDATALHHAVFANQESVVELLLECFPDLIDLPTKNLITPLMIAKAYFYQSLIDLLKKKTLQSVNDDNPIPKKELVSDLHMPKDEKG